MLDVEMRGAVALVTINNPPVNALGQTVRTALVAAIDRFENDASVRAVVVTGAGNIFVGGADITEFDHPLSAPMAPDIFNAIEAANKPWIAAVNGAALGGGLELAMACRWRIASSTARFALPEINLGVIPGAGGTQRLPRIIGVAAAVPVCCDNRSLSAAEALELSLIDQLVDRDLLEAAIALAGNLPTRWPVPASERAVPPFTLDWDETRRQLEKRARGNVAPLKALEAVRIGVEDGFAVGAAAERAHFIALRQSLEAAALRHLFFAERAAAKRARGTEAARTITRVGVVGGGTMGTGIAAAFADAGYSVLLVERDDAAINRALDTLDQLYRSAAARGRLLQAEADRRFARIDGAVGYGQMAACDLVIEAVFEDIVVKQAVFAELSEACAPDAILATNTSYLDPRIIAQTVVNPARFIGLHFFSPAQVMKLLEVVAIPQTRADVLATCLDVANRLGKVAIPAGICEGFIGNRILLAYRAAAEVLVRDGIALEQIDAAMRNFGFAMGPFEMQDMAGLDIAFRQREGARAAGAEVSETLGDILARAGRIGSKVGAGWYDYEPGDRKPRPSAATAALLASVAGRPRFVAVEEISARLVAAMAEEGERILAEGIAANAADIDLVEVHGYGFPRFRGGPMFYARATRTTTGSTPSRSGP